jgi:hypothetical protein
VSAIGDLFGEDSAIRQLLVWNVFGQILSTLMAPGLAELTQLVNETAVSATGSSPPVPLSPADAADAVVRGFLSTAAGAGFAAKAGVGGEDFSTLVQLAGDAPSPTDLIMAFRRGLIPLDGGSPDAVGVRQGIAQGRLADKWVPMIEGLGQVPLGVADAVDAVVEGQISMADGVAIAYTNGLSAENFTILYNTRGNPPDPTTLAEALRRNVIGKDATGPDALSFRQGISEGATKDKWIPVLESLLTVLPPARTVTALQRSGAITAVQALDYYAQLGLDQATAAQYVADATSVKTQASKNLALSDVLTLYTDRAIDAPTATAMLQSLGYEPSECVYLLQIQDLHLAVTNISAAITRIKAEYIVGKLDTTTVTNALNALSVPGAQQQQLLAIWAIEVATNVKTLTPAQVVDAWNYKILTDAQALTELRGLGYSEQDAYVLLSIKNQGPLAASLPPAGVSVTG